MNMITINNDMTNILLSYDKYDNDNTIIILILVVILILSIMAS